MRSALLVCVVLLLAFALIAFQLPPRRTLSIAGRPGYARLVEANGKTFVDVQDLARLMQASLTFDGDRIVLTLPADPIQDPPSAAGFSIQFLQAEIEQLSSVREWRITILNSIQSNSPVSEHWISELQMRAQSNLALVGAARSTDDDQKCYPLLAAEYANMKKLSDRFLSKRRQLQYIDPSALDNDPLDQQILACGHSLAAMAADNQFRDEAQCTEAR